MDIRYFVRSKFSRSLVRKKKKWIDTTSSFWSLSQPLCFRKIEKYKKKVSEINYRLKNYCNQKNIDFLENTNTKDEHLGSRKLYLNK